MWRCSCSCRSSFASARSASICSSTRRRTERRPDCMGEGARQDVVRRGRPQPGHLRVRGSSPKASASCSGMSTSYKGVTPDMFDSATEVAMLENRRSTSTIVALGNAVVGGEAWSGRDGAPVEVRSATSRADELASIATKAEGALVQQYVAMFMFIYSLRVRIAPEQFLDDPARTRRIAVAIGAPSRERQVAPVARHVESGDMGRRWRFTTQVWRDSSGRRSAALKSGGSVSLSYFFASLLVRTYCARRAGPTPSCETAFTTMRCQPNALHGSPPNRRSGRGTPF